MKVSVQKSVGFLRFSNFVKFAKQKEKPAQMPGFLSKFTGGSGWIRTTSVVRQQIYSLPRLSNSGARPELIVSLLPDTFLWCEQRESNPHFKLGRLAFQPLNYARNEFISYTIISYFLKNASIYSNNRKKAYRENCALVNSMFNQFNFVFLIVFQCVFSFF